MKRLIDQMRRQRADPRWHVRLTWSSLAALLLTAALTAASIWAAVSLLPQANSRGDYRFLLGALPMLAYPVLHARFRRDGEH